MKLLLRKYGIGSAPGDILVMTAAVESLAIQRPEYEISVQTAYHELWYGNPSVKNVHPWGQEVSGYDKEAVVHYDHIHGSQERGNSQLDPSLQSPGCNFVQAFTWGIGRALEEDIGIRRNTPVVFLTKEDQNWLGSFRKEYGEGPFVLLSPSIKRDTTVKAWPVEHYQAVIDHFKDRATFIQLGDPGCMGCELDGVVNLVGKTSLRHVLALAYKAKAAIGPVTYLLHACAAFGTPYVCLAGGREQPSWIPYPHVQYLHTMGEMDCCNRLACWKQRVIPLPLMPYGVSEAQLAAENAQNQNICKYPIVGMKRPVSKCMHDISPEQVITILERHAKNWTREVSVSPNAHQEKHWEGLGDVVAWATKLFGINPCNGCNERRVKLNNLVPFGKRKKEKVRPYLERRSVPNVGVISLRKGDWADQNVVREMSRDDYGLASLPECKRVVDVGAHIGSFTLSALNRWDCQVASVEANRRNIPLLAFNTKGKATIIPAAMRYENPALLHNGAHRKGNTGGSTLVPDIKAWLNEPLFGVEEVPSITLEGVLDVMGWDSIDLLKLDCEGSEFDILEHADLSNVKCIVGEWHDSAKFFEMVERLAGWQVDILRNGGIGLFRLRCR